MTEAAALVFRSGSRTLSASWLSARSAVAAAVLAHGAGAGMSHPFMAGVADGLTAQGVSCLRFNFPYIEEGRRSPDRPPVLLESWRAALGETARLAGELPLVAGGKSLGGRMASMLAAEEGPRFRGRALVFFGYPLHAPGRVDQPRDSHLSAIRVPMLFIQGTADALANFGLVEELVARLRPLAHLHVVPGGDHSFRVRGVRRPDLEIGRELGTVAGSFAQEAVP